MSQQPTKKDAPIETPAQGGQATPQSEYTRVTEKVARKIISDYRHKLTWFLHVPELEPVFEEGLETLDLPGPRKGINLRAALNSLLIENKFALIKWALANFRGQISFPVAEGIDKRFGLELFSRKSLDQVLSMRQWIELKDKVAYAMAAEHRKYKNAQLVLFHKYQGMVDYVVNRKVFDAAKRQDAYQEGALGLVHAIDKVEANDDSLGSYAQAWVSRQVKNFLMGQRFAVHVPINLASRALSQGNEARTTEEAASPAEQSTEERLTALIYERLRQPSLSIEEVLEGGGEGDLADAQAVDPRDYVSRRDMCELVTAVIEQLTDKQREVLALRFGLNSGGEGGTLTAISEMIGISHQQVSMREKRALQKIETALKPVLAELYG